MANENNIGAIIRELRRTRGLTQAQLADRSGRTLDTISQLERGVNSPSLDTLMAISNGLSMTMTSVVSLLEVDVGDSHVRELERAHAAITKLPSGDLLVAIDILEALARHSNR
ncbi:helix-turn-helix transcriptional regulator [Rhizobium sp. TH2]|uniref:helix-turn-helix domain-containing protein n=1 Tax=Rhizobium sp. TH2 TaxID=2775403 RepID=UPI002157BDAE|nr:helix-turn-helix transcriptional regulator [Rhizobium sp. TH2]UVC08985.1 helix-turn-helix transcriptional regulator [Rhizobium sp. TH2]